MGGGVSGFWVVNQSFLVSVLCLMGFPFFCGFFSKDLLLEIYFMTEGSLVESVVFMGGFSLSVLYGTRLYLMVSGKSGEGKICGGLGEVKFMSLGVIMLSLFALGGGAIYSWLEDFYEGVMLNLSGKGLGLTLMLVGVIYSMVWLVVVDGGVKGGGLGGGGLGSSSENLVSLMGGLGYSVLSGSNYGDDDQTWVEELGGGFYYMSSDGVFKFWGGKMVDFFLLVFFMALVFVMFI